MTWVDLINSLTGQNSTSVDTSTAGLGVMAEADEQAALADTVTAVVLTANPGWDQGQWGVGVWQ